MQHTSAFRTGYLKNPDERLIAGILHLELKAVAGTIADADDDHRVVGENKERKSLAWPSRSFAILIVQLTAAIGPLIR